MSYQGDFAVSASLPAWLPFETQVNGVLAAAVGLTVALYHLTQPTTPITAGITLTQDVNGIVGSHLARVDVSNAAYAAGRNYQLRVLTGTVGGVSIVGMDIGNFALQARYMRGTDAAALAGDAMTLTPAERLASAAAAGMRSVVEPLTYSAIGVLPGQDELLLKIHGLLSNFKFTGLDQSIKRLDAPAVEAVRYTIDDENRASEHVRTA